MPRILSLDPGHTTGIAVYNDKGELELSMTVSKEKAYKNGFLNHLVSLAKPEVVLVENVPINRVDQQTFDLHFYFRHWFTTAGFEVVDIKPGQWKGLVERVEIPGQHARDAATMAKFWLRTQEKAK